MLASSVDIGTVNCAQLSLGRCFAEIRVDTPLIGGGVIDVSVIPNKPPLKFLHEYDRHRLDLPKIPKSQKLG